MLGFKRYKGIKLSVTISKMLNVGLGVRWYVNSVLYRKCYVKSFTKKMISFNFAFVAKRNEMVLDYHISC